MDKDMARSDAGMKSLDHYKTRLPKWRYHPREKLLPIVRWETPYLAYLQEKMRSPALDTYFALTANLGTHTFFVTVLPMFFWCGYTDLGRGMIHVLGSGVYCSGFVKDALCLPRPLSPPLQRITMSGSAALEYGFPSSHSTNAVSVAVYALYFLNCSDTSMSYTMNLSLQALCCAYALSIVLGRLYCGMHGFFDVIIGGAIGAGLALVQCIYGDSFDNFIQNGSLKEIFVVILVILVLVRIHPEPADDCPCFDDSVSFAGVIIGIEFGYWHYGRSGNAWSDPVPATVPFSLEALGWTRTILRIVFGVLAIFTWRGIMKPLLLRGLPPLFRVFEKLGLSLPRRFFLQSSTYKKVPDQLRDDNVIPPVSEIPAFLTSIRHPRRRAVSIGPQSEADAYETLAYREKRRRDSISSGIISPRSPTANGTSDGSGAYFGNKDNNTPRAPVNDGTAKPSKLHIYEEMMGTGMESPTSPMAYGSSSPVLGPAQDAVTQLEEKEIFSRLQKPRVRYDVEVVTKLIVYSGIAWLAQEGNALMFQAIGLGLPS